MLFAMVHRIFRVAIPTRGTGFDFGEYQDALMKGDQIDLGMSEAPVCLQNQIAFFFKVFTGNFLSPFTQFVMGCHNLIIFVFIKIMKHVIFKDWGLIDYQQAWDQQEALFNETVRIKTGNRQLPDGMAPVITPDYLVFCEHPHVFTLGKSGKVDHLLLDEEALTKVNASFYKINRGGDITYHGPGQIEIGRASCRERVCQDV